MRASTTVRELAIAATPRVPLSATTVTGLHFERATSLAAVGVTFRRQKSRVA
jgi:hypothetical protein